MIKAPLSKVKLLGNSPFALFRPFCSEERRREGRRVLNEDLNESLPVLLSLVFVCFSVPANIRGLSMHILEGGGRVRGSEGKDR